MPNFITIEQTMYEKTVTIFYTLQYFVATGLPVSKFTNLGPDVQQVPLYQPTKFNFVSF